MFRRRCSRPLFILVIVFATCLAPAARTQVTPPTTAPPLLALTVGGGPEPRYNQVAIESNVRYFHDLLPAGARETILFADGKTDTPSVTYLDAPTTPAPAERAFRFLFNEPLVIQPERRRAPRLPLLSGPTRQDAITDAVGRLAATAKTTPTNAPVLLYFTGHGSTPRSGDLDNNRFDLWGGGALTVRETAPLVAQLPAGRPVVLVMVQCYAGAFGNLLFERGDPKGEFVDRDLCGFFATVKERPAAGCTPEVNEAEYRDFSSSFFAALSGRDRVGRTIAVTAADYDKNGRVGMNEAFAYALLNEPTIDIPVATTDVFLRRFVPLSDRDLLATPYQTLIAAATPAQRAVLDGLSRTLNLSGENRLRIAFETMRTRLEREDAEERGLAAPGDAAVRLFRLSQLRRSERARLIERFPVLRSGRPSPARTDARAQAIAALGELPPGRLSALNAGADEWARYEDETLADAVTTARWVRWVRVAKSVVLAQRLRASNRPDLVARFDRLRAAEARNPLR